MPKELMTNRKRKRVEGRKKKRKCRWCENTVYAVLVPDRELRDWSCGQCNYMVRTEGPVIRITTQIVRIPQSFL